ncbi:MAG: hypothetical protein ABI382_08765 [Nakamurella sp.]
MDMYRALEVTSVHEVITETLRLPGAMVQVRNFECPDPTESFMIAIRLAATATAFVFLLAGCSAGSPHSVSAATGTVKSDPSAAATAQPTSATIDAPHSDAAHSTVNAAGGSSVRCSSVTKADAQALMTDPITTVTNSAFGLLPNPDGQNCAFNADGASLNITVFPDADQLLNYAAGVKEFAKPVSVPGIGDRAARDGAEESGAMISVKGGIVCSVSASDENIPGVGKLDLAAGGTNNIGDANYAIIAAALGTLCNRIYGSGNTTPDLGGLRAIPATSTP